MKVVDQNTILEVGKFYNVLCAEIVNKVDEIIEYVPVIGQKHTDPQFGIKMQHYHIDGRFTKQGCYSVDCFGRTNQVLTTEKEARYPDWVSRVVIKRKKCIRLTTGINPPPKSSAYKEWYSSMVGKNCKGRRCPHLGHRMAEVNGFLQCPLHGLVGDIEAGKIIPHRDLFVDQYYRKINGASQRSKIVAQKFENK